MIEELKRLEEIALEPDLELSDDEPDPECEERLKQLPPDHGMKVYLRAKARFLFRRKFGSKKPPLPQ
ncbi:MAG: hypothetical protein ACREXY_19920 [Gammaproteobacteria bacterium]